MKLSDEDRKFTMGLVRGIDAANLCSFIIERWGSNAWAGLLARLSQEDRTWIEGITIDETAPSRVLGGEGAGAVRCFVLELKGRRLGRVEIEDAAITGPEGRLLAKLFPGFAIALDETVGARPSKVYEPVHSASGGGPSSETAALRLRAASERWGLTRRETQVLGLCAHGRTNKEIARDLAREEVTIERHMSRILRKSGAGNRTALVARFWTDT